MSCKMDRPIISSAVYPNIFPRRFVPTLDDAVQVFTNNGIISRINDGGQVKKGVICRVCGFDVWHGSGLVLLYFRIALPPVSSMQSSNLAPENFLARVSFGHFRRSEAAQMCSVCRQTLFASSLSDPGGPPFRVMRHITPNVLNEAAPAKGCIVRSGLPRKVAMDASRLFKCRVFVVVEDDPLVLQATAAIVRSFGFSVRTAEDRFVALKVLRGVLPDIILTDLRMPGMSGFELLSIVRRRFPHIPTIAISGEYILANMPLRPACGSFLSKRQLYTTRASCQDGRGNRSLPNTATPWGNITAPPLWIPRTNTDYLVVTCPDCLRSVSIAR